MMDDITPKKPVVLTNLSSSTSEDVSDALTSIFERYGYARPIQFVGQSDDMGAIMEAMRAVTYWLLMAATAQRRRWPLPPGNKMSPSLRRYSLWCRG